MRGLFFASAALPMVAYAGYAQTRYYQNCASMDMSILCMGGLQGNGPDSSGIIYKIDLKSVGSSIQTSQLSGVWSSVTPNTNNNNRNSGIETRHSSVIQNLNDGLRILISGGGVNGVDGNLTLPTPLQNGTIVYHTDTNTITVIPAFRNVLDASGVYLPYSKLLYFYGGSLDTNLTAPGYPTITRLNMTNPIKWTEVQNAINVPTYNSNYIVRGQTATLGPKNLIYFLGGRFTVGPDTVTSTAPSFQSPYIFDPQQSIWTPQVTLGGGSSIPSNRYGHSATLLPNSHRIFIFGGARVSNGQNDDSNFAYILDLDSNSYTQVNLSTSPSGLASRYGHSAVLMNNSLFIMFGKSNGQLTNEIDMIDVSNSDPTTIQWSSVYPPVQETVNHSGGKTSAGTIAGATVGSVVGVGIIAGALFLFLRRKKSKEDNKDKKFDDYSNIDYSHQATYETSPRPMQYTAEIPDMNDHASVPPVYYGSKPEEDINAYNKENFLKSPHYNDATTNSTSNIKPDEVDEDLFQKPNRYEP